MLTILGDKGKIDNSMVVFGIVFFIVLGTVVASFLNVCVDRLPNNESLLFPPSRCASCHHRLSAWDLIPVFSYLRLRGRCRYCQAFIPSRLLWVEIGTGLLFGYLYWHYGLSIELAAGILYSSIAIVLMVIDLEQGLILNKIVFPSAAVALVISIFLAPSRLAYPNETVGSLLNNFNFLPQPGIVQAAIGGGIGLVCFSLIIILSRGEWAGAMPKWPAWLA